MYKNIYDPGQKKFYQIFLNLNRQKISKHKPEQKGIREYLLCNDCEGKLNKYETYASETIYAKNNRNRSRLLHKEIFGANLEIYHFEGFDYNNLKLFLLSIFWRLCVSSKFKIPKIDDLIIEQLRNAIYNENPLSYDQFGCCMQIPYLKRGHPVKSILISPFITGNGSNKVFNVLIDSFILSFHLNSETLNQDHKRLFLQENGNFMIIGRQIQKGEILFIKLRRSFEYLINIYGK